MDDRLVQHASGAALRIAAVGIDCSDGQTSDAVYAFVRRHNRPHRPVLALKGAPDDIGRVEIWQPPKAIDPSGRSTKAAKYGVLVHIVGAARAKDLLIGYATESGRLRLIGSGPARLHWYDTVRADFYDQLLSEIKIPSRRNPNVRAWRHLAGRRNEALDCTTGCLYLVRHLRLHLRKPAQWDYVEAAIRQHGLIGDPDQSGLDAPPPDSPPTAAGDTPAAQIKKQSRPDPMAAILAARRAARRE